VPWSHQELGERSHTMANIYKRFPENGGFMQLGLTGKVY